MNHQPLNLRRSLQIVRRNKTLIGVTVAIGLLGGAGYGSVNPPMLTAQSLVVLPTSAPPMATEIVIAESAPVLADALPAVSPAMSAETLRSRIQVASQTNNILQITAQGGTAVQAEGNANAVAKSYISYLSSSESPVGQVNAKLLSPVSTATGTSPIVHRIAFGVVGALIGFIISFIVAMARGRGTNRLRLRDDIANSIGVPVLASIPAAHPSSAAEWAKLLNTYQPGPVYAWRLRKALQQLSLSGVHLAGSRDGGSGSTVSVISLAGDRGALALGPQLAVFTSSLGIPTALVVGPQQDARFTATLSTACAEYQRSAAGRGGMLRAAVSDDTGGFSGYPGAMLTVVVSVVDADSPEVAATARTIATVIGVSANAVSAEQLARVAVSAAAEEREIAGFLVANPDPIDHTTGRIPQLVRLPQQIMPTRVTGRVTEAKR
jgi:capsular polysaccharide biosynthesis protein